MLFFTLLLDRKDKLFYTVELGKREQTAFRTSTHIGFFLCSSTVRVSMCRKGSRSPLAPETSGGLFGRIGAALLCPGHLSASMHQAKVKKSVFAPISRTNSERCLVRLSTARGAFWSAPLSTARIDRSSASSSVFLSSWPVPSPPRTLIDWFVVQGQSNKPVLLPFPRRWRCSTQENLTSQRVP